MQANSNQSGNTLVVVNRDYMRSIHITDALKPKPRETERSTLRIKYFVPKSNEILKLYVFS